VPRGWAVVSSFANGGTNSGLSLLHPLTPGPAIPITGLPADLTGTGLTPPAGAGSVLVDERTGLLVVGEHAPTGQSLDVHVISLAGTAVARILSYSLGTVTGVSGSTDQMAWVGNDILVCNRGGAGPLGGNQLGLVRPTLGPPNTPGTVVPLPITFNPPGTSNALAVDPQGRNAYLGRFVFLGGNTYQSEIYRISLAGPWPATPVLVVQISDVILQLAFDADGLLLAGMGFPTPRLHAIDVSRNVVVASSTVPTLGDINALTRERATGDLLAGDSTTNRVYRMARLGAGLYAPPVALATILGIVSGSAVRPCLTTYGTASPGTNTYTWQTAPNPGGLPRLGSGTFSLTVRSSPGTAQGVLALSFGSPTPPPLLLGGITLLLYPNTLLVHALLPAQSAVTVPLGPIPNSLPLAGLDVFAQTVHFEPTGWAASDGLWLTLF